MQPLAWVFILFVAATGALHIRAEYLGPRRAVYVFKPLTTICILALALIGPTPELAAYKNWIVLGLLFSLGGDIFLMLPSNRFVAGLASFLIAHLCYIAAFTTGTGFQWSLAALLPLVIYGAVMLGLLRSHLGRMRGPVLVYIAVILVMGWQAIARAGRLWPTRARCWPCSVR